MSFNAEQMKMLVDWQEAKEQARNYATRERELRDAIAEFAVPTGNIGTHRFPIGDGWSVKIKLGEKAELDKSASPDVFAKIWHSLIEAGLTPEEASALVKTKQELSEGAYNKLSANMQKIMAPAIIVKPVAPTIELEAPKPTKE